MTSTNDSTPHDAEHCFECNPGVAHLGESMTIEPGEWTLIDDNSTEIYLYGEQAVTIVIRASA